MANLSVRKIDEETLKKLKIRAAEHGVSMEEEVRQILMQSVRAPSRLGDLAKAFFGTQHGIDLAIPEHPKHEAVDLTACF